MRTPGDVIHILHECFGRYGEVEGFLDHANPFQLLVSVILSAQTTDEQVNRCTPELFRQYPDSLAMSKADPAQLESLVKSTGYYRVKARHLCAAAGWLETYHGGKVPDSMEELVRIPGVGRKSAGVILHHVYNKPAIIVDTHFARVTRRLGITDSEDPLKIENDVAAVSAPEHWGAISMLLNLHGRRICHARKPRCAECFLLETCPSTILSSLKH